MIRDGLETEPFQMPEACDWNLYQQATVSFVRGEYAAE
jgi:hypothetical protein